MIEEFFERYGRISEIAVVHSFFTLAAFSSLWSGLLSVAPVVFAAIAGFSGAFMTNELNLPIELIIVLGVLIGAGSAYLTSLPLLRLSSHWVALATIALLLISRVVILNIEGFTGGASGVQWLREISTWHIVVALAVVIWYFLRVRRSRLGLATEAVRADKDVAAALGVPGTRVQRIAFVVSGAVAGVGGVLFGNLLQFIGPLTYFVNLTFLMLAAVVLGGRFHWAGAVVGAIVFTALPEVMRVFLDGGEDIANGILLILIIIYLPGGLVEPGRRERRRGAREAAAEAAKEFEADADAELDQTEKDAALRLQETTQLQRSLPPLDLTAERALVVESLSKSFGGIAAVKNLSFSVPTGAIFGVLGPNGAGKTTALNLISGLESPDSGRISVHGVDVSTMEPFERAEIGLSRTFQAVRLFEGLTVLENIMVGEHTRRDSRTWEALLALPSERRERREAEERARELMDRVGVIGRPDQYAGTLSYANQRRAEIARALASKPSILLLDEPTAGMHKLGTVAVGELLLQLQEEGLTIVVVEHNMQLILDYCQRALVMDFGQALCEGLPKDCLDAPQVVEAYFGKQSDAERIESLIKLRQH